MNLIHTSIVSPADSPYFKCMLGELDTMQSRSSRNIAWSITIDFIRKQALIVLQLVGSHSAGNIIEMFIHQFKHHESGLSTGKALVGDCDYFSYDYSLFREFKDENVTCADIPFSKWPIEDISCATLLDLVVNTLNGKKILIYCANYFVAKSLLYIFKRMQIVQNSPIVMDDYQENRNAFFESKSGLLLTHKHDLCCLPIPNTFLILLSPPPLLKWSANVYCILDDAFILKELTFLHDEEIEEGEISFLGHSAQSGSNNRFCDKNFIISKPHLINAIMQASADIPVKTFSFSPLPFSESFSLFVFQSSSSSFGVLYPHEFKTCSFEIFGYNCYVNSISLSSANFSIISNFSEFCGFNIVLINDNNIDIPRMQQIMNKQSLSSHLIDFINIFDNPELCPQFALEYGFLQDLIVKIKDDNLLYTIEGVNTDIFTDNVLHLNLLPLFGNDEIKTINCQLLDLVGLQKAELIKMKIMSEQMEVTSGITAALLSLEIDKIAISIDPANSYCFIGTLVNKVYFNGASLPENVINGMGIVFSSSCAEIQKIQKIQIANKVEHTDAMNKLFNKNMLYVDEIPDVAAFSFTLLIFSKIFKNITNGIFISNIEQLASIKVSDIVGYEYVPCLYASAVDFKEFGEIIRNWCAPLKFKYSSEMGLKSYLKKVGINSKLLRCYSNIPSPSKERINLNLKDILLAKGESEKDVYDQLFGYFIKYFDASTTFNLQ